MGDGKKNDLKMVNEREDKQRHMEQLKKLTHSNMIEEIKESRARSNKRLQKRDYGSPARIVFEQTTNTIEHIGCFDSPFGKQIDYETRLDVQDGYNLANQLRPR